MSTLPPPQPAPVATRRAVAEGPCRGQGMVLHDCTGPGQLVFPTPQTAQAGTGTGAVKTGPPPAPIPAVGAPLSSRHPSGRCAGQKEKESGQTRTLFVASRILGPPALFTTVHASPSNAAQAAARRCSGLSPDASSGQSTGSSASALSISRLSKPSARGVGGRNK